MPKNKVPRQSFIYPTFEEKHGVYGASFLSAPIINPNGDWRRHLPPHEIQRRNNVESSACYVEASQHAIATIEEYKGIGIDNNYSARFNALLSDGSEIGGIPTKAGSSICDDGLVKEESMPFDLSIESWDEFHSWKGVDRDTVIAEGKADVSVMKRNYGAFVQRHFPLETKFALLRKGLQRSPVPISIWAVADDNGQYIEKPKGVADTHLVEAVYVSDDNVIHILDTYPPFEKTLPKNYDFDFAMGWTVEKRKVPLVGGNWLLDIICRVFGAIPGMLRGLWTSLYTALSRGV